MQGEPRSDWRSSLGGPDVRRRRFSSSPPTLLLHILSSHDDRPHESPAKNTTTTSTVSVGVGIDINDYTSGVVEEGETGEALAEAEAKARQPAMPCVYDGILLPWVSHTATTIA